MENLTDGDVQLLRTAVVGRIVIVADVPEMCFPPHMTFPSPNFVYINNKVRSIATDRIVWGWSRNKLRRDVRGFLEITEAPYFYSGKYVGFGCH